MYLDLILEGNGERWQVNVSPSDIVSWRRVTSSFSKHETVCAIWMLKIVIKKKKISCITSAYLWPKQTKN